MCSVPFKYVHCKCGAVWLGFYKLASVSVGSMYDFKRLMREEVCTLRTLGRV